MARRKTRTLTELELEIMQIVWQKGEATTDDVVAALNQKGGNLSSGTVRKMFSILMNKGYLTRKKPGAKFLYKAEVGKGQATKKMVIDLLKRAFGGSAALMMASIIDTRFVDEKDIEEVERLLEERRKGRSK